MSSVATKPLLRFSSLVRRKDKQETPYQTWQEEDDEDVPDGPRSARTPTTPTNPVVEFTAIAFSSPEPLTDTDNGLQRQGSLCRRERLKADELLECFYIGSYDMTGLAIRGRGCINLPASIIWQHSQDQDRKPRRVGSWSGRQQHSSTSSRRTSLGAAGVKPRYVKLVTGADSLHVQDQGTEEVVMVFSYRKISFVGTHPKYNRLFAFIAETQNLATTFCHAFKCENATSAKKAACMLSDVFQKKIQELVRQATQKEASAVSPS